MECFCFWHSPFFGKRHNLLVSTLRRWLRLFPYHGRFVTTVSKSRVCVSYFSIFASFVFVFASYEVVAHCSNRKVHAYLWFAPCTSKPPKPNQIQTVYSSTPTNYSRTNISFGVHNSNITACHCHVRYHFHKQFHIIYYHLVFPSHCLLYTVRHTTALLIVCYTSTWRNLLHE